jgi:hypothetical protein
MHDNPLTNSTNVCNKTTHRTPTKPINPRRNLNWPPPTSNPLDIRHARTNNAQDAPPHRFDFR